MTAWHRGPFIAVDTETTGTNTAEDRIVQVAAVWVNPNGNIDHPWEMIVDCGVEIPDEVAAIHGITTERSKAEGLPPSEALKYLADTMDADLPIVMFNAKFDLPLILTECARHKVVVKHVPLVLDPFVIDKAYDRYRRGSRKLVDVAAHYGVLLDESDAHGALADATAAGRLMFALIERFPDLMERSLVEVFNRTCRQAENQRASFEDYMRTQKDPGFSSPAGWPIPVGSVA